MNKLVDAYYDTFADIEPVYDPDQMFKPLNPELEYVDVTEYELEMAHRVQTLHEEVKTLKEQVNQIALNTLAMAQHIKALNLRLTEQSTSAPQSAIILPDRFN